MPRVKLLAGAPSAHRVSDESTWTISRFKPAFSLVLGGDINKIQIQESQDSSASPSEKIAWRALPLQPQHLPTGFSQPSFLLHSPLDFAYRDDQASSSADSDADAESAFHAHSFALHSQPAHTAIPEDPQRRCQDTMPDLSRTFLTTLAALPSPGKLVSLAPQTVTVDLLVGVISAPPARTVTVRRTGRAVELVELVVGDDTRAGFGVSIWLDDGSAGSDAVHGASKRRSRGEAQTASMRAQLSRCRAGQLVLLRRVVLSAFRGVVYGASMARGGWRTTLTVMDGRLLMTLGEDGAVADRAAAVSAWIRYFIPSAAKRRLAAEAGEEKKSKRVRVEEDLPPDDTQA